MLMRFAVSLLALVVVRSAWCVERKKFTHIGDTSIRLTQHATIEYFLQKLNEAHAAIFKSPKHKKTLLAVHSDVHGDGVKVNFRYWTEKGTYHYVYEKEVGIQGEMQLKVRISKALKDHHRWKFHATLCEKDVVEQNHDLLKAVVAKRSEGTQDKEGDGRSYQLKIDACLLLTEPTECYFYWHPIDGIVGLAIDRVHDECTMYQAEWKTIFKEAYRTSYWRSYTIKVTYFKTDKKRPISYFLKLVSNMKPSDHPSSVGAADNPKALLEYPMVTAPPNTPIYYGNSFGHIGDDCHCIIANQDDKHIVSSSCDDVYDEDRKDEKKKEKKHTIDFIIN